MLKKKDCIFLPYHLALIWRQAGVQQDVSGLVWGRSLHDDWMKSVNKTCWLRNDMSNMWEVCMFVSFIHSGCSLDQQQCVQVLHFPASVKNVFMSLLWTHFPCELIWSCQVNVTGLLRAKALQWGVKMIVLLLVILERGCCLFFTIARASVCGM